MQQREPLLPLLGVMFSLDLTDIDGDGKPDLVSVFNSINNIVSVKLNTSSSTTTAVSSLAADEFIRLGL